MFEATKQLNIFYFSYLEYKTVAIDKPQPSGLKASIQNDL